MLREQLPPAARQLGRRGARGGVGATVAGLLLGRAGERAGHGGDAGDERQRDARGHETLPFRHVPKSGAPRGHATRAGQIENPRVAATQSLRRRGTAARPGRAPYPSRSIWRRISRYIQAAARTADRPQRSSSMPAMPAS